MSAQGKLGFSLGPIVRRDMTMQVNVKGVWFGCKHAIQAMRANPVDVNRRLQTGGSIINTASFVGLMGAATPQLACEFWRFPARPGSSRPQTLHQRCML